MDDEERSLRFDDFMSAVVFRPEIAAKRAQVVVQRVRRTFVVNIEHGLHARPCALLVKTVQPYRSTVEVEAHGNKVSGNSILGLMALAAGYGSQITFTMVGEDALQAMAAVHRLFAAHFEAALRAPKASIKPVMALAGASP
jgi:phosphocarrier protein